MERQLLSTAAGLTAQLATVFLSLILEALSLQLAAQPTAVPLVALPVQMEATSP
jgi:hypothetical protein